MTEKVNTLEDLAQKISKFQITIHKRLFVL